MMKQVEFFVFCYCVWIIYIPYRIYSYPIIYQYTERFCCVYDWLGPVWVNEGITVNKSAAVISRYLNVIFMFINLFFNQLEHLNPSLERVGWWRPSYVAHIQKDIRVRQSETDNMMFFLNVVRFFCSCGDACWWCDCFWTILLNASFLFWAWFSYCSPHCSISNKWD